MDRACQYAPRSLTLISVTLAHSDMSRATATEIYEPASFNDQEYMLSKYHEMGNCMGRRRRLVWSITLGRTSSDQNLTDNFGRELVGFVL
jgi:hypothetical protein